MIRRHLVVLDKIRPTPLVQIVANWRVLYVPMNSTSFALVGLSADFRTTETNFNHCSSYCVVPFVTSFYE